jgi:hypothetical protein
MSKQLIHERRPFGRILTMNKKISPERKDISRGFTHHLVSNFSLALAAMTGICAEITPPLAFGETPAAIVSNNIAKPLANKSTTTKPIKILINTDKNTAKRTFVLPKTVATKIKSERNDILKIVPVPVSDILNECKDLFGITKQIIVNFPVEYWLNLITVSESLIVILMGGIFFVSSWT